MSLSGRQDSVVAAPTVVPIVAPRRTLNPLIPICCLGLVLFLIAVAIVLSLIPVYLKTKDATSRAGLGSRGELNLILRNGYLPLGSLTPDNCAAVQAELRQRAAANSNVRPSVPTLDSCTVTQNSSTTSSGGRKKRAVGNTLRLVVFMSAGNCITNNCVLSRANAFFALILGAGDISISLTQADGTPFTFIGFFTQQSAPVIVLPSSGGTSSTASASGATTPAVGVTSSTAALSLTTTTTTTTIPASRTNISVIFYAVNGQNQLLRYNTTNVGSVLDTRSITGVVSGDIISNIDFRPNTGDLYGTSNTRLYIIDVNTAVARAIGQPLSSTYGNITSMEADSNTDIFIFQTTTSGPYLAIEPGSNIFLGPYTPNGTTGSSMGLDNNLAGSLSSKVYYINATSSALYVNDIVKTLNSVKVGSGFGITINDSIGFDISPDGLALACLKVNGSLVVYVVDLNNGTLKENLGVISEPIISLAIPTAPVSYAVVSSNNSLLYINSLASGLKFTAKNLTGLQANESIVGIDMRPYNGQVFVLGSTSRLYTIRLGAGVLDQLGNTSFSTLLSGTAFGMDFNPTVDLIRVVSNTGQNLRISPATGAVAGVDSAINPNGSYITAIAYSNNVFNASTTVLYDIDSNLDQLDSQISPNNGTVVKIGALGVDVGEANGFDIGSSSNNGFGVFTVNGVTSLYTINLATGQATTNSSNVFPVAVKAFTTGHNT